MRPTLCQFGLPAYARIAKTLSDQRLYKSLRTGVPGNGPKHFGAGRGTSAHRSRVETCKPVPPTIKPPGIAQVNPLNTHSRHQEVA
jgi:hypothetical protein